MTSLPNDFRGRLLSMDDAAWRELEKDFGRFIVAGIRGRSGNGFSPATVDDLRQEVLALLLRNVQKYDTTRGTSFSSWIQSFGKHVASNHLQQARAAKRSHGLRSSESDLRVGDSEENAENTPEVHELEVRLFRAKVMRALRIVEEKLGFKSCQVYLLRVNERLSGAHIAETLGVSPATVTRLQREVRAAVRAEIGSAIREFSWTTEEARELEVHGLDRERDDDFDEALSQVLQMSE